MRSIIFLLLLLTCNVSVALAQPVLLFSDMTSAPKTGWDGSATQGAAITIWGYNLGDSRGSSYVTVNGQDLDDDADYAVWGEYWPTPYWQRITFWLNSDMSDGAGSITVTVNGETSNSLDFTIRSGNIFFVDDVAQGGAGTLSDPYAVSELTSGNGGGVAENAAPGSLFYFRQMNVRNEVLYFSFKRVNGTVTHPKAILAYPGEKPRLYNDYVKRGEGILTFDQKYYTVSGLTVDAQVKAVGIHGTGSRLIGNDLMGLQQTGSGGSGTATSRENNQVILGNAFHGGRSHNPLDHAMYIQGCSDSVGAKFGWNYIYDNDYGRGPLVSVNHQDQPGGSGPLDRCKSHQVLASHYIFSNVIDCNPQRATAIGVFEQSYKYGESEPEPTYVYNNLILNCGVKDSGDSAVAGASATYGINGHTRFYHNTLYNTQFAAFRSYYRHFLSTEIKNNIAHVIPGGDGTPVYVDFNRPGGQLNLTFLQANTEISNNIFYGLSSPFSCSGCGEDQNNNDVDPLFVDPDNGDFRLQETSPAINASTSINFEVDPPGWAGIDRDKNYMLRVGSYDLGAIEFGSTTQSSQQNASNQSESVAQPNRAPVLDSSFPPAFTRMNVSKKRVFRVNVSDQDNDTITYSWKINGVEVGTNPSFVLNGSLYSLGDTNITVNITDGNVSIHKNWKFKLRTPKKHDITDDDNVDVEDLKIVARHMLKKKAFREQYDQNSDGVVNIYDLISIIREFGTY